MHRGLSGVNDKTFLPQSCEFCSHLTKHVLKSRETVLHCGDSFCVNSLRCAYRAHNFALFRKDPAWVNTRTIKATVLLFYLVCWVNPLGECDWGVSVDIQVSSRYPKGACVSGSPKCGTCEQSIIRPLVMHIETVRSFVPFLQKL